MAKKIAYGGVVFDDHRRVLLRKPKGEFDGYKWTFPKGRPGDGEVAEETALREVLEESGCKARIIGQVPGKFGGGTTENFYYLMEPVESGLKFDEETEAIRWATIDEAKELISQTTNSVGRQRDLAVIEAAVRSYKNLDPVQSIFWLLSVPYRHLAQTAHEILCELHAGCTPKVCAANSTPYVRYSPYADLFHLLITQSTCRLQISPQLQLSQYLRAAGAAVTPTKKWDVLSIDNGSALQALTQVLRWQATEIRQVFESERVVSHAKITEQHLPTVELNLDQLCSLGTPWHVSNSSIVGQVYAYRIDPLQKAVMEAGENLDVFLTARIAKGIHSRPFKKKALFWFWGVPGMIFLAVTKAGPKANFDWLRNIPGFYDFGEGNIRLDASPFVYWDGKIIHRVYAQPTSTGLDDMEEFEEEESPGNDFYIVDFGSASKLYTARTTEETYLEIKEDMQEHWEYSAVPQKSEQHLALDGTSVVIRHAFYALSGKIAGEFIEMEIF